MSGEKAVKILIVDDEPNVVTYLEALLEDAGYQTVSAADGVEGMEKIRSEKPDLVSLDITMPRKSGVRMYREIREDPELKQIPVVVVTAVTGKAHDPGEFERFLASRGKVPPPDGFLAKPIDREVFLQMIRDLVGA